MNQMPARPGEFHIADVVRGAALAAGCPIGVFLLCGKTHFEVAASFGIARRPTGRHPHTPLLQAARGSTARLVVMGEQGGEALLLSDGLPPVRFVAAVHVAYGTNPSCGLLLLADGAPHARLTDEQRYVLPVYATQLSALLELQTLRELGQVPGSRHLAADIAARTRILESERIDLETENSALEAEIQERKRIEARLHYVAFHDDLTMLHNRQFFMDRLAAALERTTREAGFQFAVLFMDLDRFKLVNDSLGHRSGDLLLIAVGERLRGCMRPQDVVARIGGDEFALLAEGFDEMELVVALAERIARVVGEPVRLGAQEVFPSCSVGAVRATRHYRLPEELLRDADIAMYHAKRQAGSYAIFNGSMHNAAISSLQLRTDLQKAVTRQEFYVEYQPIFAARSRKISGVEALVRWQHPQRGIVLPGGFIAAAEEMGLIREIGGWVLQLACEEMQTWLTKFPKLELRLSVNISGHQLKDTRFIEQLRGILATTGLPPGALQLEVTESVFLQNAEAVDHVIGDLRALGVKIALDDFGTGYSSLSYLDRYPIDAIKIDRSFVAGLPARPRTVAIVQAIIALGTALNLDVVAEGIEDEAQLTGLVALGCSQAQGFLLGRPMAAGRISKILAKA